MTSPTPADASRNGTSEPGQAASDPGSGAPNNGVPTAGAGGLEFFPVDIAHYRHHPALPTGPEIEEIARLLAPFAARSVPWTVPPHLRGADAVNERLEHWANPTKPEDSFLYWVGHGSSDGGSTTLLAHTHSPNPLTRGGISPQDLLHYLTTRQAHRGAGWAIVVIDACTSARFVDQLYAQALIDANATNFVLVATSHDGSTTIGAFRRALAIALVTAFRGQDSIDLRELATELNRSLDGSPTHAHTTAGRALLHRARPTPAAAWNTPLDVAAEITSVLADLDDDERRHFLPKAAGAELGQQNWYFEGRDSERNDIFTWLNTVEHGMLAITGPAGSGKSALLGHVLVHTRPELAAPLTRAGQLSPLPVGTSAPEDVFDAAIHLTGATPQAILARVAHTAGAPAPTATDPLARQTKSLIEHLHTRGQPGQGRQSGARLTMLLDALDEAHQPLFIAEHILRPLAALPGIRLVIGTRRSTFEGPDQPQPADQNLITALGALHPATAPHTRVLGLSRDQQAMTRYIQRRLTASAHHGTLTTDATALQATASLLGSLERHFLYARLAVHEILHAPALAQDPTPLLNTDHRGLFARAVDRLTARHPANGPLLHALALAQGHGLPARDGIWATAATALQPQDDSPVTDQEITTLLHDAAPYLMLDAEHGQSVYRLAHRTFSEHLATTRPDLARDHQDVTVALTTSADDRLPPSPPNPYLIHQLPEHAALAGPSGWTTLDQHPRILDRISPTALTTSAMLHAYGRIVLPPAVTGTIAAHHDLLAATPADRRGLREIATIRTTSRPPSHSHEDPQSAWTLCWAHLTHHPLHLTLTGHTNSVEAVAAFTTTDGRTLLATGSTDDTVRIWDPDTGQQVGEPLTGHTNSVEAVAAFTTTDGRTLLATGSTDDTVRIWDPDTGQQVGEPLTGHTNSVEAVAAFTTTDGRTLLATGSTDDTVRIWDPDTGQQVGEPLTGHTNRVEAVAAFTTTDGRTLLATGSTDYTVRIWDPDTGQQVGEPLTGLVGAVETVAAFTALDGRASLAAGGNFDGTVQIWDPDTGRPVGSPLTGHYHRVLAAAAFTGPDGRTLLATGGDDHTVRIWDPAGGQQVGEPLTGHTGAVKAVTAFTRPNERALLATGGDDQTVRIWDPTGGQQVGEPLTGHTGAVKAVTAFTRPNERALLATGGDDQTVRVWEAATGQQIGEPLTDRTGRAGAVAMFTFAAPDERILLATGSGYDCTVRIWDTATGQQIGEPLSGHASPLLAVTAFTACDGRTLLATGTADGTVRIWDPAGGQQMGKPLTGHTGWVRAVTAITTDGRILLASGSEDQTIRIWDAATGRAAGSPLTGHTSAVEAIANFTALDGRALLATGSNDRTVRAWDPLTGQQEGEPLTGHTGRVGAVAAFTTSAGRPLLATGSDDRTVRIWDPLQSEAIITVPVGMQVKAITPFDRHLALGTTGGIAVINLQAATLQ
ncbi:hypothetical protein ABZ745_31565 [Streptomyces sp. NPDC013082]|uniref:hypothetical protein n=1 Tax=Streptomyces sp. NPDC013082 TaxID=3156686 RepID=UPI0033C0028F